MIARRWVSSASQPTQPANTVGLGGGEDPAAVRQRGVLEQPGGLVLHDVEVNLVGAEPGGEAGDQGAREGGAAGLRRRPHHQVRAGGQIEVVGGLGLLVGHVGQAERDGRARRGLGLVIGQAVERKAGGQRGKQGAERCRRRCGGRLP